MSEKNEKITRAEKKLLKQQEKEAKRAEKQYKPMKGLMGNATDYNTYQLNLVERLIAFGIGFIGGFIVFYVFFRVILFSAVIGVIVGIAIQGSFRDYLLKRRKRNLLMQFKDLLEALSASYSAGLNTRAAFEDSYQDLVSIYGENAYIVEEIRLINLGLNNNFIIEDLLFDFAKRSGLDDINTFASVFSVCNRQGANLRRVISESREIINDKIEIEMDIETMLTGSKNQLNIMMVMPLIIMLTLSGMGNLSVVTNTPQNVIIKIVALAIFGLSYFLGRKISDIKI
ncbi:MAG: type II secretion system F family protein [Blautia sp.]